MSRVRMGGTGSRRNVRPCGMQQRTVQFSECVLKVVIFIYELLMSKDISRYPNYRNIL